MRILFTCLILLLINYSAFTTEYFVSNASEINSAMNNAQPGDTLTMMNGMWTNQNLVFQGSGTEGAPILLRVETPGCVILNGRSTLRIAGNYLVVDGLRFIGGYSASGGVVEFRNGGLESNHSRLTNCSIVDYNPSSRSTGYKWVSIYGTHNRVDHCYFEGKNHLGTTVTVWLDGRVNYHQIDHNYFAYRPPLGENGGETIRVGTSDWSLTDSYTTVEFNYFEQCNGEIEIISNKSCENIYRYNTFVECEGALTLRHGNRCNVYGNFFFGNKKDLTGGVRIIGEDHKVYNNYFEGLYGSSFKSALPILNGVPDSPLNRYFQVKNALVAFNTFVDCRYTMIIGAGADDERTLPPLNCTIANNLVQTSHQIIRQDAEPINMTWEGNIMQGSSLGIDQPEGIVLDDPELFFADDSLWRPMENSPVIGAAVGNYTDIVDDMDGHVRAVSKDVGADQVSLDPVLRKPLTPADVGPDWLNSPDLPLTLTITKAGNGAGNVSLDPPGGVYDSGTVVSLTAIPNEEHTFAGWSGDIESIENPIVLEMDDNKRITAIFNAPIRYNLAVWKIGSGSVEFDPPGGSYPESTLVKIMAIPDEGWIFSEWGGDLNSTNNPDSVLMDSNKGLTVTFEETVSVEPGDPKPLAYRLNQNYPNPFNPSTIITFSLKNPGFTTLFVYDVLGHKVVELVNRNLEAGFHQIEFNGSGLASGVYYYGIRSGNFSSIKKMILMR
jgi:poly(beta-D-mannuronate) lyase